MGDGEEECCVLVRQCSVFLFRSAARQSSIIEQPRTEGITADCRVYSYMRYSRVL